MINDILNIFLICFKIYYYNIIIKNIKLIIWNVRLFLHITQNRISNLIKVCYQQITL